MKKHRGRSALAILLVLAAAVLAGIWLTRSTEQPAGTARQRRPGASAYRLVDQQPLQTISQLEKLATTREEGRLAREASNLADHSVDLAFTAALRQARQRPADTDPETRALRDRVRQLEEQIRKGEEEVRRLDTALKSGKLKEPDALPLQLAQAELALHQNELEDARRDLIRAGGDPESLIQRQFTQHQATNHGDPSQAAQPVRVPFQVPDTMLAQVRLWAQLRNKRQQLTDAQQQAATSAADLNAKHADLERRLQPPQGGPSQGASDLAALQKAADDRKLLSEYDLRIQDMQQLAQVYADWAAVVSRQMKTCVNGMLQGALWIVLLLIAAIGGNAVVDKVAIKVGEDRRRIATMRLIGRFVVQGVAVVLVLFVVVGSPNQLSTVIALAGAGLTVALKDFIVAFFGWFVLMGKHGIRVGDWVEINGIVGEVVEIGLLRTVLLETGNSADAGHPTGRRVTFVNSFAIEGHYFNFTTTGQWLWDSLEFTVPAGEDPHPIMDAALQLIREKTESTADVAEKEWEHAARSAGMRSFSAAPTIDIRPTLQGTNIKIRYITRAHERFDVRARLYQSVVDLLHHRKQAAAAAPVSHGDAGQY